MPVLMMGIGVTTHKQQEIEKEYHHIRTPKGLECMWHCGILFVTRVCNPNQPCATNRDSKFRQ